MEDKIDLNDAADTLRAYEEQRDKRARSNDPRAAQQAQTAGADPHGALRRPPYLRQS